MRLWPRVWCLVFFDSRYSLILSRTDYCNAVLHDAPSGNGSAHHLQTDLQDTSVPEYLSRHTTTRSSTRSLRSSSAPLLHVPFRRTFFGKRSYSTAAPSVWNSLPVFVQNCDTLTLFKSRLKAHLFSSVFAS